MGFLIGMLIALVGCLSLSHAEALETGQSIQEIRALYGDPERVGKPIAVRDTSAHGGNMFYQVYYYKHVTIAFEGHHVYQKQLIDGRVVTYRPVPFEKITGGR